MIDLYALKVGLFWTALKSEHASLWFLSLSIFFEYVRPQTLYPQLDFLPWAQLSLIAAIVFALIDPSVKWISGSLNKLFVVLVFWIFLSGVFAFKPADSIEGWVIVVNWLIFYYLILTVVNTEQRFFLFVVIYLLFNFKMAQHGAITWAQRGFSFSGWGLTGSPGWFRNSGEYAIQMLIFGSLIIAFVISIKPYLQKWKLLIMSVVAISGYMAVMGASSRGSQLALGLIIVWMLLKIKLGLKGILFAAVVGFAAYYLLPDEQMDRFRDMGEDPTSVQRLVYWELGVDIVGENPMFGVGYENWLSYVRNIYPNGLGPLGKVELPHNIFVEIAAESGIPAISIFIIMIVVSLFCCHRTRKLAVQIENKFFQLISLGLEAGLIGYLGAGMFVTVFYYPYFWVQIAMIFSLYNIVKRQSEKNLVGKYICQVLETNDRNLRKAHAKY